MKSIRMRFPGSLDHELGGQLDTPDQGTPRAYALFAHCFTCTKNLKSIPNLSRGLTDHGFAVLRFDFTGLGDSGGNFADTNFTSNVGDLIAAARYLESIREAPAVLIGHSLGGTAALQAAAAIDGCRAVVTIAAPSDPSHLADILGQKRNEIEEKGETEVEIGGRPFRIRRQLLDDLRNQDMNGVIARMGRPLLVMHSPADHTVHIDNATRIFQAARHPKSFLSLDQADHLLMNPADATWTGHMIAAWAGRYLSPESTTG